MTYSCACDLKTTDSVAYWKDQIEKATAEMEDIPRRIQCMEKLISEATG